MSPAGTATFPFRWLPFRAWNVSNVGDQCAVAETIPDCLKRRVAPGTMGSHSLPHGRRVPGSRPRRGAEQEVCSWCNTGRPRDSVGLNAPTWSPPTRWTRDVSVWTWAVGTVRFFPKRGESPPSLPGGWFALVKTWPPSTGHNRTGTAGTGTGRPCSHCRSGRHPGLPPPSGNCPNLYNFPGA